MIVIKKIVSNFKRFRCNCNLFYNFFLCEINTSFSNNFKVYKKLNSTPIIQDSEFLSNIINYSKI